MEEQNNLNEKEIEILQRIIENNGNLSSMKGNELSNLLEKFNMKEEVRKLTELSLEPQTEDIKNDIKEIEKEISERAKEILKENGIPMPLSDDEKLQLLKEELLELGLPPDDVEQLLLNGTKEAEKEGQKFTLTFKDTEEVRDILKKNDITFEKLENGSLKVNGKLFMKEGQMFDDTPKNRKILDDNEITYFKKAEDDRKLFVPLKAKKVAALAAMGLTLGVPGIMLQIALNQTGVLNKLLDQHLLNKNQKNALDAGLTILATQRLNGKDVKQFLYLDNETGQLNRVNVQDVQISKRIMGMELSPAQIQQLKEGKTIDLGFKDGVYMGARIDLKEPGGIQSLYKEMKTDINWHTTPKVDSPEKEKLEYIALKGAEGIKDIYDGNGAQLEKDSFLEKFNMKDLYSDILKDQKALSLEPNSVLAKELFQKMDTFKNVAFDLLLDFEKEQGRKI